MAENYSSGTSPMRTDPMRVIEVKILNALNGGEGSGSATPGVVNPEGSVTANPGQTYYNTDNSTFWVKSSGTGNTGWTELL